MRAVVNTRYGAPDVLSLAEVEKPAPAEKEVLVRIHATVVTPPDCAFRAADPWITRLFGGLLRPRTTVLGSEFAGRIETVGRRTKRFSVGDRVFGTNPSFGAHADYICLPEDAALARIPDNLSFEEIVAISEGALTALPFLRDSAKLQRGQSILINGASGSVGSAAVQLARHLEADVTGVSSTGNLDLVRSLGADRVIDYTREDFTRAREAYDVIFDAVGKSSFRKCRGSLRPGGIYLTTVPSAAIPLQMLWTSRFGNKRAAIALTGLRSSTEKSADLELIADLAAAGTLRPVIDRRYPLEQVAEAHRYVETGHKKGSAIVTLGSDDN